MLTKTETVEIENQRVILELSFFNKDDFLVLSSIYKNWVDLSDLIQKNGGRRINIPELLSEAIFCYHFNGGRLNKTINGKINSSFDCLTLSPTKRIQVKSCSVSYDLTSFGPKSIWDELYFVHFYPNRRYDGTYKIYKINNDLIYNHKVNINQTMNDQQKQGKRPRFGIMKEIIEPLKLKPVIEGTLPIQS
jgi:hypothetical protein